MVGVRQTKRGGPDAPPGMRGNCFGASLASALEVPMAQVPDPPAELDVTTHDSSPWWGHYSAVALEYGFILTPFYSDAWWDWMDEHRPGMIWLAAVPSLNIPPTEAVPQPLHSVVMRDSRLAHDPSTGRRYERVRREDIVDAHSFTAVDPARCGS